MERPESAAVEEEASALARLLQTATDRTAAIAAELHAGTQTDPPVAIHSTSDRFRMTLKAPGVTAADVSTRIASDQLVVTVRQAQERREDDAQFRQIRASSSTWERSFQLQFTPAASGVSITVTPDSVIVTASRVA